MLERKVAREKKECLEQRAQKVRRGLGLVRDTTGDKTMHVLDPESRHSNEQEF